MVHKRFALAALFLVILIDSIGASLILPLLEPLLLSENSVFLSEGSPFYKSSLYGFSLMSFAAAMFIGAPMLGDLSDRVGRKPMLLYCLWGTLLGYLISGAAIIIKNPTFFILGRIIDGFTAGSLPVAQAGIIDVSDKDKTVQNLGYILFAVSIAYVGGPLIGGVLSQGVFPTYFPLFLAAAIAFINILILQSFYHDASIARESEVRLDFKLGFTHFFAAFKHAEIRNFSIILLLLQLAWTYYFQFIGFYASKTFTVDSVSIAWLLLFIGLGMALSFCFLAGKLNAKVKPRWLLSGGLLGIALLFILSMQCTQFITLCLLGFLSSVIYAVMYTSLLGLLSKHAGHKAQGLIMGIAGSISAFSAGSTALIGGFIMSLQLVTPFYMIGAILLLAGFLSNIQSISDN